MIAQDIINELQLPEDITTQISNTEDRTKVIYDLYKKGEIFLTGVELLSLAIIDGNTDIFLTNFDDIGRVNKDSLNLYLLCAKYGRIKELQRLLKWTGYDLHTLAKEAAYYSHYNVIEAIGVHDYRMIALNAARKGHKEIVLAMMKKDKNIDIDDIVREAALTGQKELLYGFDFKILDIDPSFVLSYAVRGGHVDIVDDMMKIVDRDRSTWNAAAFGGQKELLKRMISLGADDWDEIAIYATLGGQKEILDLILERLEITPSFCCRIANFAAECDHLDIVLYMIHLGANDLKAIICSAAKEGHLSTAMEIKKLNKDNTHYHSTK